MEKYQLDDAVRIQVDEACLRASIGLDYETRKTVRGTGPLELTKRNDAAADRRRAGRQRLVNTGTFPTFATLAAYRSLSRSPLRAGKRLVYQRGFRGPALDLFEDAFKVPTDKGNGHFGPSLPSFERPLGNIPAFGRGLPGQAQPEAGVPQSRGKGRPGLGRSVSVVHILHPTRYGV
jgi:hypothetical protein